MANTHTETFDLTGWRTQRTTLEAAWGTGQGRGVPERRGSPESACVPRSSLCCGQNVHPAWPTGKERTFLSRQTNHILSSVDLGICKGPQSVLTSLTQTAGAASGPRHSRGVSCGASWGHTGAGRMWLKQGSEQPRFREFTKAERAYNSLPAPPMRTTSGRPGHEERVGSGGLPSTRVVAPAEGPVCSAGSCGVSAALRASLCGHSRSTCGPAVPSGLRSGVAEPSSHGPGGLAHQRRVLAALAALLEDPSPPPRASGEAGDPGCPGLTDASPPLCLQGHLARPWPAWPHLQDIFEDLVPKSGHVLSF